MRIAFIAPRFDMGSGGGSHHTLDMMLRYFSDRAEVELIVNGERAEESAAAPYRTVSEDFTGSFLQAQRKVAEYLCAQEKNYDVYVLYGPAFIWGGGMYRKRGGSRTAVCYLNNYIPGIWPRPWSLHFVRHWLWEKSIGRSIIRGLDAIFCDSPVLCEQYRKFGFPKEKLRAMPEWVDVQALSRNASNALPKDPSVSYLLYAGRFTHDKGTDVLVRAMPRVLQEKNVTLDLVGSGAQLPELQQAVASSDLKEHVHIHPWAGPQEMAGYYARADLFVHPCRWIEPFGRTVLEAMVRGVPVVTTPGTGSSWLMGDAGAIVQADDPAGLAQTVLDLLEDKSRYQRASDAARQRAQLFDYRRIAAIFERSLQDVVSGKALPNPLFPELG